MINKKLNANESVVKDYILEAKKIYPEIDVNQYNVNDVMLMYEETLNCKKCAGLNCCKNNTKGYFTTYLNNEFKLEQCKYKQIQVKQAQTNSIINTLYMPSSILTASFENYNISCESRKKIIKYINEFITNFGKRNGLYLYSAFSKGKTYTLGAIAKELGKHNIESLLIYFPDLVVDLKSALNDSARYNKLINRLKTVDVLMLDDLGSENMTSWLRDDIIGPIINYRLMDNKPLFVSSNLEFSQLKSHFMTNPNDALKAERLVTRLNDLLITINMDDSPVYNRHN